MGLDRGRKLPLSDYIGVIWEFPKIVCAIFGGPHIKDYSILGSILGCPYLGKLPYRGLMDNQMEATLVYQICIHSCRILTADPQHEPCSSWSVESRVLIFGGHMR